MFIVASADAVAGITAGATLLAALSVAVITARTTNKRQQESLAHDRELADLADLRKLLDEAAMAVDEGRDARDVLELRLIEHGIVLPDDPRDTLASRGRVIVKLHARLLVRLGEHDPIPTHFGHLSNALHVTWQQTSNLSLASARELSERVAIVREQRERFVTEASAFLQAAFARTGVSDGGRANVVSAFKPLSDR